MNRDFGIEFYGDSYNQELRLNLPIETCLLQFIQDWLILIIYGYYTGVLSYLGGNISKSTSTSSQPYFWLQPIIGGYFYKFSSLVRWSWWLKWRRGRLVDMFLFLCIEMKRNECEQCVMKIWEQLRVSQSLLKKDLSYEYASLIRWQFWLILVLVCDWPKRRQFLGRWLPSINHLLRYAMPQALAFFIHIAHGIAPG